MKQMVKVTNC